MNYYDKTQIVAKIDRNNKIIGKVEKWEAHKKGILHKGFTVVLEYEGMLLLQHRKHPAFDNTLDLTISSHPLYEGEKLQDTVSAIYQALERELGLSQKYIIGKPIYKGVAWYKSKDAKSVFTEHEMDEIYVAKINKLPKMNVEYSYSIILQTKKQLTDKKNPLSKLLAPWVVVMLEDGLI